MEESLDKLKHNVLSRDEIVDISNKINVKLQDVMMKAFTKKATDTL
jgi:hypothetical protein